MLPVRINHNYDSNEILIRVELRMGLIPTTLLESLPWAEQGSERLRQLLRTEWLTIVQSSQTRVKDKPLTP